MNLHHLTITVHQIKQTLCSLFSSFAQYY